MNLYLARSSGGGWASTVSRLDFSWPDGSVIRAEGFCTYNPDSSPVAAPQLWWFDLIWARYQLTDRSEVSALDIVLPLFRTPKTLASFYKYF